MFAFCCFLFVSVSVAMYTHLCILLCVLFSACFFFPCVCCLRAVFVSVFLCVFLRAFVCLCFSCWIKFVVFL